MPAPLTRRTLLRTAATLAGVSLGALTARGTTRAPRLGVRLMETSDLHTFAVDWDYPHATTNPTVGLTRVASLVKAARAEAPNALLFDNGDTLQGNAFGDYIALKMDRTSEPVHPMMAAMNALGYDCAGLGNHDFNFGLEFLHYFLRGARFPYVCANVEKLDGQSYLPPYTILERTFVDEDGAPHALRIGVIGFVPPQIMIWDKAHLSGKVTASDILEAARRHLPTLRGQCDLLIGLAHSGLTTKPVARGAENVSNHLAAVEGFDALFTGHSHRVFPGPDFKADEGIDPNLGTLHSVPAVMPGFWGSHLGVIDLVIEKRDGRWQRASFKSEARPIYRREKEAVVELAPTDPAILSSVAAAHKATMAWVEEPVGAFQSRMHSYFVWFGHDPVAGLVNAAQSWYAKELLKGGPFEHLPVLSAAAPFKAGYKPEFYIDIAAGPVALKHIADIYPFANFVTAVKVTGAEVAEWLEYSAGLYNTLDEDAAEPQALINRHIPSYAFDEISGVTYEIDPREKARYDRKGQILEPTARRIKQLKFAGQAIDPAREFIVVTNNYRADGGGSFPVLGSHKIILRAPDLNRDAVQKYIASHSPIARPATGWRLASGAKKIKVTIDSSPKALTALGDVPGVRHAGPGLPGFETFELEI